MMKNERLARGAMYLLAMMPLYGFITHFFVAWQWLVFVCAAIAVIIGFAVASLPKYVGNYSETEIISYEGGLNRGSDPNPDRESRHETVKEGKRYPVRLPVAIAALLISMLLLVFIPKAAYERDGYMLFRVIFIALTAVLEAICMGSVAGENSFWTELPGVAIGFVGYLLNAIYIAAAKLEGLYATGMGIFALVFLYAGFMCLNRASISSESSVGTGTSSAPKSLLSRNRRAVLVFASLISLISFVKPVREGAMWLLRWILVFFKWLAWLLRGGKEVDKGDLNRLLEMQGFMEEVPPEEVEQMEEELEQLHTTVWDKIFVYAFFGLLALGLAFLIYSLAMRKIKRDGYLIRRKRRVAGEGYYDEKEELDSGEVREKYRRKGFFKSLFNRETPWDKLSGREKARRLLKVLYRKKQSGIQNLKSLTAGEALNRMDLKGDTAQKTLSAYDAARYSEHDVDSEKMDELRRELKL